MAITLKDNMHPRPVFLAWPKNRARPGGFQSCGSGNRILSGVSILAHEEEL